MGALRLIAVLAHGTLVVGQQQMGGDDSMAGGQMGGTGDDACMNVDCAMLSDAMQAADPCCNGGTGGGGTDWTDPGAGGDACAACMAECATDADPLGCMGGCLNDMGEPCMAGGGR